MPEKIRCPERDLNPRHPDLMTGVLTTELPRQPQRSESNIAYKGNIDYQTFAPRPLGPGITSVGRRDMLIGPDEPNYSKSNYLKCYPLFGVWLNFISLIYFWKCDHFCKCDKLF